MSTTSSSQPSSPDTNAINLAIDQYHELMYVPSDGEEGKRVKRSVKKESSPPSSQKRRRMDDAPPLAFHPSTGRTSPSTASGRHSGTSLPNPFPEKTVPPPTLGTAAYSPPLKDALELLQLRIGELQQDNEALLSAHSELFLENAHLQHELGKIQRKADRVDQLSAMERSHLEDAERELVIQKKNVSELKDIAIRNLNMRTDLQKAQEAMKEESFLRGFKSCMDQVHAFASTDLKSSYDRFRKGKGVPGPSNP